jgi:hypothetical protein
MTVALEAMSAMKTGAKAMASIHNHMYVWSALSPVVLVIVSFF